MKNTNYQKVPLILIADDAKFIRTLLRTLLEQEGYQVIEADNGKECLMSYMLHRPDMVLLDAMMPVIDGFQCCKALRNLPRGDHIPLLMVTALDDQASVDRAFEVGATDYITKPIHAAVLRRRLRHLLEASWAEEALRHSEQRYRSVVDNLKEVIFQTDTAGRLIFLNPTWVEITGYSLKESLGRTFLQFIHPGDREIYWEKLQPFVQATSSHLLQTSSSLGLTCNSVWRQFIQNHERGINRLTILKLNYLLLRQNVLFHPQWNGKTKDCRFEIRYQTKNGRTVLMEVYAYLMLREDGTLIGISGTLNDVSQRKRREQHLKAEQGVTRVLAESTTLDEAIPRILEAICQSVSWQRSELWSVSPHAHVLQCVETWYLPPTEEVQRGTFKAFDAITAKITFPPAKGLPGKVWQQGEPVWITNLNEDPHFVRKEIAAKMNYHTAFAVPILAGKECLGVMTFFQNEVQPPDWDLVKTTASIGNQIGQFIKRKQAEEELQRQNFLLQKELHQAANYVRSLLPKPLSNPVAIDQAFIPSLQLGGDVFDYYWIDSDHLVVYLVDVAGHGVQSALLSVSVLHILRSQSLTNTNFCSPGEVLAELNQIFQMNENGENYFTIWYGVYEPKKQNLTYASAGHPPAVLLSNVATDSPQVQLLESSGVPIGMLPEFDFEESTSKILPKSTLYLFSDGVYEIPQLDSSIWGMDAFISFLQDCNTLNHCKLDFVIDHLKNLNPNPSFPDDISLIEVHFP